MGRNKRGKEEKGKGKDRGIYLHIIYIRQRVGGG
jgi:hypothetical protein